MRESNGALFLTESIAALRKYKALADRAIAQVRDDDLFTVLDAEANSIAVLMRHMAGNMRSRWTDFQTSDGEKADRNRDGEFESPTGADRDSLVAEWEGGWRCTFDALETLTPNDLQSVVRIRGEPHTVLEAIQRQVMHYASHVGQIVLLAKHFAGPDWQTLSIARGKSQEYDRQSRGQ